MVEYTEITTPNGHTGLRFDKTTGVLVTSVSVRNAGKTTLYWLSADEGKAEIQILPGKSFYPRGREYGGHLHVPRYSLAVVSWVRSGSGGGRPFVLNDHIGGQMGFVHSVMSLHGGFIDLSTGNLVDGDGVLHEKLSLKVLRLYVKAFEPELVKVGARVKVSNLKPEIYG